MKLLIALIAVSAIALLPVSAADEFPTDSGPLKVTPITHATMMIEAGGKVMHVDPWSRGNYDGLPKADIILLTDTHGDHLDAAKIAELTKPGTVIVGPAAVAARVDGVKVVKHGETATVGSFELEAIPMYNEKRGPAPGQFYHEKGRGNGYVVSYGGLRIYIAGDTEGVSEMRNLRDIDVAFIPMNLPYTMPPEEAAEAVKAFKPKVVYPYHYRGSDLSKFESALAGTQIEVRLREWYP
jgi:L-ascorbate metabolism protein UlaG (beta-lactamase superfamily)